MNRGTCGAGEVVEWFKILGEWNPRHRQKGHRIEKGVRDLEVDFEGLIHPLKPLLPFHNLVAFLRDR